MPKWNLKATISGMRVGDSFFIPCIESGSLRTKIYRIGKDFGYHLVVRTTTEDLVMGVRTWRLENREAD